MRIIQIAKSEKKMWIGVDLDGTLAEYTHFKGVDQIGDPIPKMVARVKRWLKAGKTVKIFTARASGKDKAKAIKAIKAWCKEHLGKELEVTAEKDHLMTALWDDRAVRVKKNEGVRIASVEPVFVRLVGLVKYDDHGNPHSLSRDFFYEMSGSGDLAKAAYCYAQGDDLYETSDEEVASHAQIVQALPDGYVPDKKLYCENGKVAKSAMNRCPKCGGKGKWEEEHPDTDMNEMVFSCEECGHANGG